MKIANADLFQSKAFDTALAELQCCERSTNKGAMYMFGAQTTVSSLLWSTIKATRYII